MPGHPSEQAVLRDHGLAGHALDVRQQRAHLAADCGVRPLHHTVGCMTVGAVSYTHLRAHETSAHL
eukprot:2092505-Alexandrium_andersonii.AAC.1